MSLTNHHIIPFNTTLENYWYIAGCPNWPSSPYISVKEILCHLVFILLLCRYLAFFFLSHCECRLFFPFCPTVAISPLVTEPNSKYFTTFISGLFYLSVAISLYFLSHYRYAALSERDVFLI